MSATVQRPFFAVLLLLSLTACSYSAFTLTESDYKPKGKTLAVIAGLNNEVNVVAAKYVSDALGADSRFQVVSQSKVDQSLPAYPTNIKGPYKYAYLNIEPDYSRTDMKKVRDVQQQLGVDYLYVMWAPVSHTVGYQGVQLWFIGQLFEFPAGKEVGNGIYGAGASGSCLPPSLPRDKEIEDNLKQSMGYVAKKIAEESGMQKK
ncbi:MAG: hypothetical protein AABZ10_06435 [Nitrospirota bacterium]